MNMKESGVVYIGRFTDRKRKGNLIEIQLQKKIIHNYPHQIKKYSGKILF